MHRRVSGPEADRHEQVAEGGVLGAPDGVHAGEHRGLRGVGEVEADVGLVEGAQAVEEVAGVEGRGDVLALEVGVEPLGGLGVVAGPGVQGQAVLGEGHVDGRGAVGHEAHAAHRGHELLAPDGGVDRRLLREQAQDRGVVAVGQQARGAPPPGLEADEPAGGGAGLRQGHGFYF